MRSCSFNVGAGRPLHLQRHRPVEPLRARGGRDETALLADEAAFDAALADLRVRGLPLRGRIAVGYAAAPNGDGRFRRYSAYKIGQRVFSDELFVSGQWAVKDAVAMWDAASCAEELAFVRANPHDPQFTDPNLPPASTSTVAPSSPRASA